jgi:uncharacterized protein
MPKLGTVISMMDSPNTYKFGFVINDEEINKVRVGQFVELNLSEGKLIAVVTSISRSNRYFERAESVAEYEKNSSIYDNFPIDDWSYTIAETKILGVYNKFLHRCSYPPAPGADVLSVDDELLTQYLGFRSNGLTVGKLMNHDVDVNLGLSKLFQKHVAILAMSGAGKSYLMSVLLEELAERKKEDGRIGVVIFDVHGEYTQLKRSPLSDKIQIFNAPKIKLSTKNTINEISQFIKDGAQKRMFSSLFYDLIKQYRNERKHFSLKDIIQLLSQEETDKSKMKTAGLLIDSLNQLHKTRLFGKGDDPSVETLIQPGKISVINLRDIDNELSKHLIVSYYTRKLFKSIKKGKICPYLMVVEEAHNFAAERVKKNDMLARYEIERVAREGRKFGASLCLISQRPVRLSTTALSQCNTHVILRVTNPYDIKHIGESSEGIDKYMLDSVTSLKTGEALIVGEAVVQPIFVKVRKRKYEYVSNENDLESLAKLYENDLEKKYDDVSAFF